MVSAISFNLPFKRRGHSILYAMIKGCRHFVLEPHLRLQFLNVGLRSKVPSADTDHHDEENYEDDAGRNTYVCAVSLAHTTYVNMKDDNDDNEDKDEHDHHHLFVKN